MENSEQKVRRDNFFDQLKDAIIALDAEMTRSVVQAGIDENIDPLDMINAAIRPAMNVMGQRFSDGDLLLPELMLSAKAADAAMEVLGPKLTQRDVDEDALGKILMATVKDDIHDIGKNIVSLILRANGFDVVDIGVNVGSEQILEQAIENQVDIIGLSSLLITTIQRMEEFCELLEDRGLREQFRVIIGGAPVTKEYADSISADGFGSDASQAVIVAKSLLS